MRTRTLVLFPAAATALLIACGPGADPSGSTPETVTEAIGDTTVVRTLSGSVWGTEATLVPEVAIGELDGPEEYLFGSIRSIAVADDLTIYILDSQGQHVRVFDSLGVYVETLGRRGEGPGEFSEAEAIAVLPDGRVTRGLNPGRKSANYLQGCTICVSCRCTGPCWNVPRERENRF
ncbi:MAG: 6-bladed beta-propeller [Gemmatimonadota bacterium]|nr:6-bladed beta-propeller [Gemmatimonadota bacterium]